MKIGLSIYGNLRREFDYCATTFDDGIKYSVYYGGTQPLKRGPNGVDIGDVARINGQDGWFATTDTGRATEMRWVGGFASRMEASIYLFGCKMARDVPKKHHN